MNKKLERFLLHPRVKIDHIYSDPIYYIAQAWIENEDGSVMVDVDTGKFIASIGIAQRSYYDAPDEERARDIAAWRAVKSLYKKLFPKSNVVPHVYKTL